MNGEPLPREHGFPVRLVTPGLYGYVGSTKWLSKLTLTTYDAAEAYWTKRKWAINAPIKLSSRVDTPAPLSTIKAGDTVIAGVAWAQPDGVEKVEVRLDGGDWQEAELGPSAGVEYWRQWYLPWKADSGSHMIAVRATNRQGDTQISDRATPFPVGLLGHPGGRGRRSAEVFPDPPNPLAPRHRIPSTHVNERRHHEQQHPQAHRPRGPGAHHVDGHRCLRFRRLLHRLLLLVGLDAFGVLLPLGPAWRATDASADGTFGPACTAVPKSGAGSFQGMSTAPVATAASANPVL